MSKRTQEPVDQWLAKEGYFRKPTPRDPTCLFRAISEQVYHTQHYHLRVRRECIEFMKKKKHLFIDVRISTRYRIDLISRDVRCVIRLVIIFCIFFCSLYQRHLIII